MQVNIKKFLNDADIKEQLYPGKRVVKPCKQLGEYKNHCIVIDWRNPDEIKIDIKPGLSGNHLAPAVLKKYPVCFQSPTHVKIEVTNDNEENEDDDDEGKSKGKSGGGGKKMQKKKLQDIELITSRFGDSAEGSVPTIGKIKEIMVMGTKIAKQAFGNAFKELTKQIKHAHIATTELLAKAADLVTRVAPPSYVTPKGDETVKYNYDREKNADIGFNMSIG